jgi:hypothetical protein
MEKRIVPLDSQAAGTLLGIRSWTISFSERRVSVDAEGNLF